MQRKLQYMIRGWTPQRIVFLRESILYMVHFCNLICFFLRMVI
jgi:hypothetical protein